jgi:hypothetical protein
MTLTLALPPRQIIREWSLQVTEELEAVVLLRSQDDPPVQIVPDSRPMLFRTLDAKASLKAEGDAHGQRPANRPLPDETEEPADR